MRFSSLLFILLFFTITMLAYGKMFRIDKKNKALFVASLVFYALGGLRALAVVLLMALVSWGFGLLIARSDQQERMRKWYLTAGVVLQILILLGFKYVVLFLTPLHMIAGVPKDMPVIVISVGVSVNALQMISYLVDIYREDAMPQKKYWMVVLGGGLFFQCTAGPIIPYKEMEYELEHRTSRYPEVGEGINRFAIGLLKVAFFANRCGAIADVWIPTANDKLAQVPVLGIWLGVLVYMFELYLEFSGYADMAVGLGLMTGFHLKENFAYPFVARSVTELYERWNLSLREFFEDYLLRPMQSWCDTERGKLLVGVLIAVLTGLWYGPYWNLVLWGLFMAAFLLLERRGFSHKLKRLPRIVSHIYTLAVIYVGCIIFRSTQLTDIGRILKGMIGLNHRGFTSLEVNATLGANLLFFIVVILLGTPMPRHIYRVVRRRFGRLYDVLEIAGPAVMMAIVLIALIGNHFYAAL